MIPPTSVHVVERPAQDAQNCLRCGKRASLVLTVQDWTRDLCLVMVTCPGHYLVTRELAEEEAARLYGPLAPLPGPPPEDLRWRCDRCGRQSLGQVGAAAHAVICQARR